jgi:TatD DNase family protein
MIIDSHVNLHAPQFDEDRDAVIARAREAGVGLMVEISDKVSTFEAHPWPGHGARRHLVHRRRPPARGQGKPDLTAAGWPSWPLARAWSASASAGWTSTTTSAPATCRLLCSAGTRAARETGLPLVVHTREADAVMAPS